MSSCHVASCAEIFKCPQSILFSDPWFSRQSEVNQYGVCGGSRINLNKSELLSHFSGFFVCFASANGGGGGGGLKPPASQLPTALVLVY